MTKPSYFTKSLSLLAIMLVMIGSPTKADQAPFPDDCEHLSMLIEDQHYLIEQNQIALGVNKDLWQAAFRNYRNAFYDIIKTRQAGGSRELVAEKRRIAAGFAREVSAHSLKADVLEKALKSKELVLDDLRAKYSENCEFGLPYLPDEEEFIGNDPYVNEDGSIGGL